MSNVGKFAQLVLLSTALPTVARGAVNAVPSSLAAPGSVYLMVIPTSVNSLGGFASGLAGDFALTPDFRVEASYERQAMMSVASGNGGAISDYDYLGARARYSAFRAFDLFAGVGRRTFRYEAQFAPDSSTNAPNESYAVDSKTIGAEAGIGTRWQIGRFVMGCDWVSAFRPLSQSGLTIQTVGTPNTTHENSVIEDVDTHASAMTYGFARVTMGGSF